MRVIKTKQRTRLDVNAALHPTETNLQPRSISNLLKNKQQQMSH